MTTKRFPIPQFKLNRENLQRLGAAFIIIFTVSLFLISQRSQMMPMASGNPTALPATGQPEHKAPSPTAAPSPTTEVQLPSGWAMLTATTEGSWAPEGALFAIPEQPYKYDGERIGVRCRILLVVPEGQIPPRPWVPCWLIGEPESTAAPPPSYSPAYVWNEEPAQEELSAPEPTAVPFPTFDVRTADLNNPYDATQVSCLASGEGCPTPSAGGTSGGKYWGAP